MKKCVLTVTKAAFCMEDGQDIIIEETERQNDIVLFEDARGSIRVTCFQKGGLTAIHADGRLRKNTPAFGYQPALCAQRSGRGSTLCVHLSAQGVVDASGLRGKLSGASA